MGDKHHHSPQLLTEDRDSICGPVGPEEETGGRRGVWKLLKLYAQWCR